MEHSLFDSKMTSKLNSKLRDVKSSGYQQLATRNIKFEQFLQDIFQSKLSAAEVQDNIVKYVQALETNYNELLRSFKDIVKTQTIEKKQ